MKPGPCDQSIVPSSSIAPPGSDGSAGFRSDGARYEEGALLGRGGMGEVRVGFDRILEREVAIKTSTRREDLLIREAQLSGLLEHPGIVPVYDAGRREDGAFFYAMRIVRGESLAERLRGLREGRGRVAPEEPGRLLGALLEASRAVAFAHGRGIVHRDLKPANIVLGELGVVQVVDWGLAVRLGEPTIGGAGTPGFMAPEQQRGDPPDPRHDVWSLGVILGEIASACAGAPRRWRRAKGPPGELMAIVKQATGTFEDRYTDARAFAEDLERYLQNRAVLAHRYRLRQHIVRIWRGRRVAVIAALAGLLLAVMAGIVAFLAVSAERDEAILARAQASSRTVERDLAVLVADREKAKVIESQVLTLARAQRRFEAERVAALVRPYTSPALLGALASVTAPPRVELLEDTAVPPGCLRVRYDVLSRVLICSRGDELIVFDHREGALVERWRVRRAHHDAAWHAPDERVALFAGDRMELVGPGEAGAVASVSWRPRALHIDARRGLYWSFEGRSVQLVTPAEEGFASIEPSPRDEQTLVASDLLRNDASTELAVATADGRLARIERVGGSLQVRDIFEIAPRLASEVSALSSPTASTVVVGTRRGEVALIDLDTRRMLARAPSAVGPVRRVLAREDVAVVAGEDGRLGIWSPIGDVWWGGLPEGLGRDGIDWARRDELVTVDDRLRRWRVVRAGALASQAEGISAMAVSEDGRFVATGDESGLTVRDAASLERVERVEGLGRMVKALVFDGHDVLSLSAGPPALWSRGRSPTFTESASLVGEGRRMGRLGGRLIVCEYLRRVSAIDQRGVETLELQAEITDASFRPVDGHGTLIDLDGRVFALRPGPPLELVLIGSHPLGDVVAAGRHFGAALVSSQRELGVFEQPGGARLLEARSTITELVISEDDRWVAVGEKSGRVAVHDRDSGTLLLEVTPHDERVSALAFRPGALELFSVSWDGSLVRLDLAALEPHERR